MNNPITDQQKIQFIYHHVSKNGKCINKAQSCWGADRYEWKGITVTLEDDGYTNGVFYGNRLKCRTTCDRPVTYDAGDAKMLHIVYSGLIDSMIEDVK